MQTVRDSNDMVSFWRSMHTHQAPATTSESSCSSIDTSSMLSCVQAVHWMITNRGGFALLTGLVMVPSQFGRDTQISHSTIEDAAKTSIEGYKVEQFTLTIEDGSVIGGIIYYPPGYNSDDKSRAVLYHNPNGATTANFFLEGRLCWTPGEIATLRKCPVIMYDYRGTGLSQENYTSSMRFRPTYDSVVVDGTAMQKYALERFNYIEAWGSSLGGAVGTKALDKHLTLFPSHSVRVDWTNHDSLTTTSRVVLPSFGSFADWIGSPFGGNLDAETSMANLIRRNVKITVLCHRADPVIPAGARMAEFVESFLPKDTLRILYSPQYGHANLSSDLIEQLQAAPREISP